MLFLYIYYSIIYDLLFLYLLFLYLLFIIYYLIIIYYLLFIIYYLLFIIYLFIYNLKRINFESYDTKFKLKLDLYIELCILHYKQLILYY